MNLYYITLQICLKVIYKCGITTVKQLKEMTGQKLHPTLCGMNKKHKLGLQNPTIEEINGWLSK